MGERGLATLKRKRQPDAAADRAVAATAAGVTSMQVDSSAGCAYTDVPTYDEDLVEAGKPSELYGVVVCAPTRSDVYVGRDHPTVVAVRSLLAEVNACVSRFGPRVAGRIEGGWDDGLWQNGPGLRDGRGFIADAMVGAMNFRASVEYKLPRNAPYASRITMSLTCVMSGSGQGAPWKVLLLRAQEATIDDAVPRSRRAEA